MSRAVNRWSWAEAPGLPAVVRGGRLRAARDELAPEPQAADCQALGQAAIESRLAARTQTAAAFIVPEFDQGVIQAVLDEALAADSTVRNPAETTVTDIAAPLPPDQRRLLAEGLQRNGPLRYPKQNVVVPALMWLALRRTFEAASLDIGVVRVKQDHV